MNEEKNSNGGIKVGERAEQFLASFNRIEKWLRDELGNPRNMGFSEMVRRLDKQRNQIGRAHV